MMNAPAPRKRSSAEHEDASSMSSTQSDAIDSMRPLVPKPRKRRRTIMDAFNSIQLKAESEEDADSSQAVGGQEDYSTSSSLEDDDAYEYDDNRPSSVLLSDREKAKRDVERKVMLELVFGPNDPVERKFCNIVHDSMSKQRSATINRDDMHIETSYSRSSSTESYSNSLPSTIQRSNSLPNMMFWDDNEPDTEMSID